MFRKGLAFYLTLAVLSSFTVFTPNVGADTIFVDDDGSADFTTIQEAVNESEEGDTIFIHSGTYYENLVIDKSINLMGEDRENTIIDGSKKDDVILVNSDHVKINNLTVKNSGTVSGYPEWNAGIDIQSSHNTVTNCNVVSNGADGITLNGASENLISGNLMTSNRKAGLILMSSSRRNIVVNNTMAFNKFHGLWILYGSDSNNFEYNNISYNNIRGIVLVNSDRNIFRNNTISNNKEFGIYIVVHHAQNNIIYHNNFINNPTHAYDEGSNIWNASAPDYGNYWDNWLSPDSDSDGIVDTPMEIEGGGNRDYRPLAAPSNIEYSGNPYENNEEINKEKDEEDLFNMYFLIFFFSMIILTVIIVIVIIVNIRRKNDPPPI